MNFKLVFNLNLKTIYSIYYQIKIFLIYLFNYYLFTKNIYYLFIKHNFKMSKKTPTNWVKNLFLKLFQCRFKHYIQYIYHLHIYKSNFQ